MDFIANVVVPNVQPISSVDRRRLVYSEVIGPILSQLALNLSCGGVELKN
jgi:hypothetical protein